MKYMDSEIYGRVAVPKSLTEVLALAKEHSANRQNVHIWRGQGDIDWKINSSAFRRLSRRKSKVTERDMQNYELELLEAASHQGYRFEAGRELSDFELLAKLQHHGAATRLIDCSRNILVALWFACSSNSDKTGLLFGVHCHHLGGWEGRGESNVYLKALEGLEEYNHPQTWQPPVVSKRIAAQSAQFLFSNVQENKYGSLAIDVDKPDTHLAIGLTPKFKKELLRDLVNFFDLRHYTLFPDIDGFSFAQSLNFDEYENFRW